MKASDSGDRSLLELLFPRVGEIEVFLMALAMIVVAGVFIDLDTLGGLWAAFKEQTGAESALYVVPAIAGVLLAALAVSLALPFTHRDWELSQYVMALHGLLIAVGNGYYVFANLGAGFDVTYALNCLFFVYAVVWLAMLLFPWADYTNDVVGLDEREAEPREAIYAGAVCVLLILVGVWVIELHPVLLYSFAALGASSIHRTVMQVFHGRAPG